jgi:protein-tyrosine phosphatase
MAAAVLARHLEVARIAGETTSAGTNVITVCPATDDAVDAAAELWFDLSDHKSARLDEMCVANADLVLALSREHAREVVVLEPAAYWRTFTFKELVRRGEATPRTDEPFADWLFARASERASPEELLGASPADDIADPIGQPISEYRRTITELDDLADRLVRVAWPRGE